MKRVEIVGMSIFGLLVVIAFIFAIRREARERQRVARYSFERGWTCLKPGEGGLAALLKETTPDLTWTPNPIIRVGSPPESVYFFGFRVATRGRGHSGATTGYACLAQRTANQPQQVVTIEVRVPLLDNLVSGRVEMGDDGFRHNFTVSCRDATSAYAVVNPEVQRILLDHITELQWDIAVTIERRAVLLQSHSAQAESEWDQLIALTRKLREAVR